MPAPAAFVIVIGMIELVRGVLLIAGVLTRPAALVLAGDMIGAIIVSGIARGDGRSHRRAGGARGDAGAALDRPRFHVPATDPSISMCTRPAELLR